MPPPSLSSRRVTSRQNRSIVLHDVDFVVVADRHSFLPPLLICPSVVAAISCNSSVASPSLEQKRRTAVSTTQICHLPASSCASVFSIAEHGSSTLNSRCTNPASTLPPLAFLPQGFEASEGTQIMLAL